MWDRHLPSCCTSLDVAPRKIKGYFTEIVEYAQPLSKGFFHKTSTAKAETVVYLSSTMDHCKISDNRRTSDNMISDINKISESMHVQTAHKSYVMLHPPLAREARRPWRDLRQPLSLT
jgi:hypothetical protein